MKYNAYLLEVLPRAAIPAFMLEKIDELNGNQQMTFMRGRVTHVLWVIVHDGMSKIEKVVKDAETYEIRALRTTGGKQ